MMIAPRALAVGGGGLEWSDHSCLYCCYYSYDCYQLLSLLLLCLILLLLLLLLIVITIIIIANNNNIIIMFTIISWGSGLEISRGSKPITITKSDIRYRITITDNDNR